MQPLSLFSTVESTQGIATEYSESASATIYFGDRLDLLRQIPDSAARLIVTSPPYNIGKAYERRTGLDTYLRGQEETLKEAVRVLARNGSLCWQVGNHVDGSEVYPLDILIYPICKRLGLMLRNRIVWHFEHGLNARGDSQDAMKRSSGLRRVTTTFSTLIRCGFRRSILEKNTSRGRKWASFPAIRSGRIRAIYGSFRT